MSLRHRTVLVLATIAAAVAARPAEAQEPSALFTLGRHFLGIGLEYPLFSHVSLAGRVEGVPLNIRAVWGAGLRIDLAQSSTVRLHANTLAGQATCGNLLESGSGGCESDWRMAVGGLGGLDFRLDSLGHWSAGVEAGYWHASDGPDDLSHMTFGATVRRHLR